MKRASVFAFPAIALLVSLQLLRPSHAYACSCGKPPPSVRLADSNAVFSGTVLRDTQQKHSASDGGSYIEHAYLFEVMSTWKGVTSSRVTIYFETDFVSPEGFSIRGCEAKGFDVGQTYLVYAYKDVGITPYEGRGRLSSSINFCSGTGPLNLADQDLKVLGAGQQPVVQASQSFPLDFLGFIQDVLSWLFALVQVPRI